MTAPESTVAVARLLMIGGLVGAFALVFVSWPAALVCLGAAALGRRIMVRGRPSSRWAYGWTAFRSRPRR